ncbi:MAG: two-component system response regulator [Sphingobacteriales bacterium]|nr:two-component system response regulator [Sphingobacteriales bacterium]
MTINAIIVDDEEYSRKALYFLLEEKCDQVNITGIAKSVAEARELIKTQPVDVVFLDISMPNENGFELLPLLQERKISVIFTTANDQYAMRAIKASAADYLLKPININELIEAVIKVSTWKMLLDIKAQYETRYMNSIDNLLQNLNTQNTIKKITLPHSQGFHVLDISSIVYVEADSNYSVFYLESNEKIIVSKPLKEYEEILESVNFIRIHKSTIINLRYLKEYSNKNGFVVLLQNGVELQVSRRRTPEFLEGVKSFFQQ